MVNYNNGKVYKIVCDTTALVYVGSTTKNYLSQRLDQHRRNFKYWKNGTCRYVTAFKVLENENYTIVLLEAVNCETKDQLTARERFYIESNVCVNKHIPLRTQKEYREANKEQTKEYRETNKEYFKEYHKEYRKTNKESIAEKKKDYYEANKEANKDTIAEKIKVKIACECGGTHTVGNKSHHCKTLKHMKYCEGSS
tara:strand:+ start:68 stop:658 length:591 start_codon:yes stop_codon:yes gene_type:complete